MRTLVSASATNISNTAQVALSTVSENYTVSFAQGCAEGEAVPYTIAHTTVNEREEGIGIYNLATGLTRSFVTETFNGSSLVRFGAKLAFTAGTVRIVVYPHGAAPDSFAIPGLLSNVTSDANAKNYAFGCFVAQAVTATALTANRLWLQPFKKATSRAFTGALALNVGTSPYVGTNSRFGVYVMNPDGSVGANLITTGTNQIAVSAGTGWKETGVILSGALDIPPGWYWRAFISDTADVIGFMPPAFYDFGAILGSLNVFGSLTKTLSGWSGTPGMPAIPTDMTLVSATTLTPLIAPIFA